jgi:hypothetical protein
MLAVVEAKVTANLELEETMEFLLLLVLQVVVETEADILQA